MIERLMDSGNDRMESLFVPAYVKWLQDISTPLAGWLSAPWTVTSTKWTDSAGLLCFEQQHQANSKIMLYQPAGPPRLANATNSCLHCRMVERTMDFDINQKDRFGRTALMWAAEMNHKETVETLIDLGGDRKIVEPQGGRWVLWPIKHVMCLT